MRKVLINSRTKKLPKVTGVIFINGNRCNQFPEILKILADETYIILRLLSLIQTGKQC